MSTIEGKRLCRKTYSIFPLWKIGLCLLWSYYVAIYPVRNSLRKKHSHFSGVDNHVGGGGSYSLTETTVAKMPAN